MASSKTSKASSAESILKHCLRKLGLTVAYRQGTLSNEQLTRLLEEVRQYGRAWLRHEAEEFVRDWVSADNESRSGLDSTSRDSIYCESRNQSDVESSVERSVQWATKTDRFIHSVKRFFARAKQFVRELILSATMALSGPAPLTGEELEDADREAWKQDMFFDNFYHEIITPPQKIVTDIVDTTSQVITVEPAPITPGQFIARAESYGNSAWQAAQRINRGQAMLHGIFKAERRILGHPKTEHCDDCPPLAALGWQPIGTLPAIGESECGHLCLCHFEYTTEELYDVMPEGSPVRPEDAETNSGHVPISPDDYSLMPEGSPVRPKDYDAKEYKPGEHTGKIVPTYIQGKAKPPKIDKPPKQVPPIVTPEGDVVTYQYEESE